MDKLKEQLKELTRKYHSLTDQAREMLTAEEVDIEAVKSLNDDIELIRGQIVEVERTLATMAEQEDARQADLQAAEEERQAEVDKLAEDKAKAMIKSLGVERPDYTGTEGEPETPDLPAHMQRIQVGSIFDEMGMLDLTMDYYVKARAAKISDSPRPSEYMYRALVTRAAEFVREVDLVPRLDQYGEVKMVEWPAFNPREFQAELKRSSREPDTWLVGDREVKHKDNLTPDGIKSLWNLGLKADELVHTTQASYGDEWVPTLMSAALWRRIRLDANVLAALPQFDMPSQPYDYGREDADPTFFKVGETTAENQLVIGANMPIGDSKIGTKKITFTAGKIGALTFWSEEMNEDSIIKPEPQFRDQFGLAVAHKVDYVLLHGDETTGGTTNISYHGATPAGTEAFLIVDGLRHQPLVTTTADKRLGGSLNLEDVNKTRKLMGTAGVHAANVADLVMFTDTATGMTFEDIDEVKTVDKYGAGATVMRGELGDIKGIRILKSQDYGLTDANGEIDVATPANNSLGQFMIVNRRGVSVGWRRRPRIYVGQIPYSDAWYILALCRFDVGFFEPGMVGLTYGITI